MKNLIGLILAICMVTFASAQSNNYEYSRKVSTRGTAEREITPDILYLSISLREYLPDGNSKKKVTIETLEKQLYTAAMANGVSKDNFTIQNVYSYNSNPNKKKDNPELLQAKQYRLKVTNLNGLNEMLDKVDAKGIQSTSVSGYDHSQKREIEKELKIAAVKDAQANAEIIASATGDGIGKVLAINDNTNFSWNDLIPQPRAYSMARAADVSLESAGESLDISVRPIKLTCNIDAVFELK
ncbi:SIMPL domain-containing protein [Sphingobacterium shayense]|uniref:SIMPL domain-containing protein n=1 Tax=Sphingobacterium shayense TaxID=626343 RepID=UPI001551DBB4|nr:SIMPL domain-containing protein [Sphingobacterium shayense]NQD72234.1 SIMPL domain-containing protein [Sphingobacterium shayense]